MGEIEAEDYGHSSQQVAPSTALVAAEEDEGDGEYEGEIVDKSKLFNDSSSAEELLILQDGISSLEGSIEFDGSAQSITLNINTQQE